jgi:hypothetical protein
MPEYKNILIKNRIDKYKQALSDAEFGFGDGRTNTEEQILY